MAETKPLEGKMVVLGVTGSIAAYKAALLARQLMEQGGRVYVIMTYSATKFVTPLTFQALTGNPVLVDMFDPQTPWQIDHVYLGTKADLVIVAPCTANIIGKIAHGLAEDMVTMTVMATKAPVIIAPAMEVNMYQSPLVQENIAKLKKMGYHFVGPETGRLATGREGQGRLSEPEEILARALEVMSQPRKLPSARK